MPNTLNPPIASIYDKIKELMSYEVIQTRCNTCVFCNNLECYKLKGIVFPVATNGSVDGIA